MIIRFIIWMIIFFVAAKILGYVVRSVRLLMTPNRNIGKHTPAERQRGTTPVEDIPYEEVKDNQ